MMRKETPRVPIVLVHHQDPDSTPSHAITDIGARGHVFFPNDREEERAGAVHDGDVGETPIPVVFAQGFDNEEEEGVLGN